MYATYRQKWDRTINDQTMTKSQYGTRPRSENRFKHLFDLIQDAVVEIEMVDEEPIVRSVNPAFEEVFGYAAENIRGRSLNRFIVPESYTTEAKGLDTRTSDGEYNDEILTRETADGKCEFLYRGVPYEHDGGQYAFAIYSDISEQKQREQQLKKKNRQLDEFTSILTHDLRNPINIAEGYLSEIKTSENEECIECIERAHDRMRTIIDDTLTLTREAQTVEHTQRVPISEVANAAWSVTDTAEADLVIEDTVSISCDPDRLSRLFENLFRNAIDHNEDTVTVEIGIHHTMTTATRADTESTNGFYIQDDGCGIPREKRNEVLKMGETTSRSGTGLGLSIVKRIADAHDWSIQVSESLEGGAKFVFTNVDMH